jgi:hypothetical protein
MRVLLENRGSKSSKLSFYKSIKSKLETEVYLQNVKNRNHKKSLTALRISAHRLMIEQGRYSNLERKDRLCSICGVVENEVHFLQHCAIYDTCRDVFMNELNMHCSVFSRKTFMDLFPVSNPKIQCIFAKFVYDCFQIRNNQLNL